MRKQRLLVTAVSAPWMGTHPALKYIEEKFGEQPERLTRAFYRSLARKTRFDPHIIREGQLVPYEACVPFTLEDTFHFLFPRTAQTPIQLGQGGHTYATAPILMCHGEGVDDHWREVAALAFTGTFAHVYKGMWEREIQSSKDS